MKNHKFRNRQCEEIYKLPPRALSSGLTFAWGYLQSIEANEERSIEERDVAKFALNAIAARLLEPGTLKKIREEEGQP